VKFFSPESPFYFLTIIKVQSLLSPPPNFSSLIGFLNYSYFFSPLSAISSVTSAESALSERLLQFSLWTIDLVESASLFFVRPYPPFPFRRETPRFFGTLFNLVVLFTCDFIAREVVRKPSPVFQTHFSQPRQRVFLQSAPIPSSAMAADSLRAASLSSPPSFPCSFFRNPATPPVHVSKCGRKSATYS